MLTYEKVVQKLLRGENFSYSRFGDGEFNCMLGKDGSNGDGHRYWADLGHKLVEVLCSKPRYYVGTRKFLPREGVNGRRYESLLGKVEWESSEIFILPSYEEKLEGFFSALNTRNVVLVANGTLLKIKNFKHSNVEISPLDCWLNYELVRNRIDAKICRNDVIVYCAGMMSCVLIDYFYGEWGEGVTQIDCGSVLDPYVGVSSRGYHKDLVKRWIDEKKK